jgi:O-acetyl-ADP-ribose deacetylase (regulator of RNase III)
MPARSAIAVSSNLTLAPNNNPHYWRFAGRKGTNGAVHDAAGPELLAAVQQLPILQDDDDDETTAAVGIAARSNIRCNISRAVSTPAFGSLPSDYVVHAVCPDGM